MVEKFEPVSIIMPVLNNLQYTKNFMESFKKKTTPNYELIIINNASTDGTREYLESIQDNKMIIVNNEENIGVAPSWNQGIKLAKYDYICIVNNDIEFMTPNWLNEMQLILKKSPEKVYWTSPATYYDKKKPICSGARISHYEQLRYGPFDSAYVVACCFMCPRKAFDELGLFDEKFAMKYYEDLDYINRILQAAKRVQMAQNVIVFHAVGATSRITPGGDLNRAYYDSKWGEFPRFDILKKQPAKVKAIRHFDAK